MFPIAGAFSMSLSEFAHPPFDREAKDYLASLLGMKSQDFATIESETLTGYFGAKKKKAAALGSDLPTTRFSLEAGAERELDLPVCSNTNLVTDGRGFHSPGRTRL